ncbi:hypothetical protein QUC32_02895 [Novosphingobium resinovorum]|uniref:hypothetical protein n=1 Tax=Novosphingobium TaxID=165696 RepID=UPI001B3C83BE|nr:MULTISPECIES: hypothetical protein [Novosphingobium]MBF7013782.1 hypothetical protein [Novosphingobium sp. HR1a]WJM25924.1 hypothetical protein QUC32_02895 [Novosphingobium resinovorum]
MNTRREKSDLPSAKRKGRAAVAVIGIVLAIVAVTFVGYNIAHVKVMEQEKKSGEKEYTGLN